MCVVSLLYNIKNIGYCFFNSVPTKSAKKHNNLPSSKTGYLFYKLRRPGGRSER